MQVGQPLDRIREGLFVDGWILEPEYGYGLTDRESQQILGCSVIFLLTGEILLPMRFKLHRTLLGSANKTALIQNG